LPSVGSLCASFLSVYKIPEVWRARDEAKMRARVLIEQAKALPLNDPEKFKGLRNGIRNELAAIANSQSDSAVFSVEEKQKNTAESDANKKKKAHK
jgi:hypothetical protein